MPTHQVLMFLDKTIGQLVDYLEEEGWLDNSVIVVASDNGGCAPDGGSNVPLRGVKNSYWEGGVKVRKNIFGRNMTEDAGWQETPNVSRGEAHLLDFIGTVEPRALV